MTSAHRDPFRFALGLQPVELRPILRGDWCQNVCVWSVFFQSLLLLRF